MCNAILRDIWPSFIVDKQRAGARAKEQIAGTTANAPWVIAVRMSTGRLFTYIVVVDSRGFLFRGECP